ncbi:MAG TPA: FKBP-type peptidyl-prolyl cis-trans isomerase [Bacteroidales bacterium]|nr:FKBP-type peptidyl-prolyl cis-trans isomerase [Bacteroidales bacterium]
MQVKLLIIKMLFILFIAVISSCITPVQDKSEVKNPNYKESLIKANKYIRARSRAHIVAFNERVEWNLQETSTGLWYEIIDTGNGNHIEQNSFVSYSFKTRLLTGEVCYEADNNNPRSIVIGKDNIETGLQEGLLMLREGAKARFIIPPFLAHGNFGDGMKIPGAAVLITEVEILSVKR